MSVGEVCPRRTMELPVVNAVIQAVIKDGDWPRFRLDKTKAGRMSRFVSTSWGKVHYRPALAGTPLRYPRPSPAFKRGSKHKDTAAPVLNLTPGFMRDE